ncbi:Thumpd2, partial [Symbiodinium sp. CCMP2592]
MVWLAITADSWDSVWKVKRQLEELGIASPGSVSIHGDGKIFLETSMEILLERVVCLSMVERVFLCVHREGLHEEHAICHLGPNYKLLQEWIYAIDWREVFRVIDVIHGGHRPETWMLDSKRHGAKGSPMRAFDRLEMQQKVRDVLHEVLSAYGCSHHPYNAGLMVYVFLSASLAFVGIPILHRRVKQGYFPHKGLHHSLCWGLASVARLQDRELVLDPMAGKGVVLLEAAAWWPQCHFLGLELVSEQLVQAVENLRYANERGVLPCGQAVGFARADCRKLPLAAKCVDV